MLWMISRIGTSHNNGIIRDFRIVGNRIDACVERPDKEDFCKQWECYATINDGRSHPFSGKARRVTFEDLAHDLRNDFAKEICRIFSVQNRANLSGTSWSGITVKLIPVTSS